MIPELGRACLEFSLITLLVQAFGLYPWKKGHALRGYVPAAAILSFVLVGFSFLSLIYSFAISDFSVALVATNSHTLKPLVYKIAGTWGNHEGSMLMFLTFITCLTAIYLFWALEKHKALVLPVLGSQGLLGFGIALFATLTSNPFLRLFPAPEQGDGLNPLLQDIGLAMHPPMLYAGYVTLSLAFSHALAGLIALPQGKAWAKALKPWVQIAWILLTIGIALGSWWAYRELGWGGYWFWDPVENASLLPWLTATALLHSLRVVEVRGQQVKWSYLLSILTFALALVGFFLVRSGILMSVHSFALDPARGVGILLLLGGSAGVALTLFGMRAHKLKETGGYNALSREGFLLWNNLMLVVLCFIVLLGTLYPLFIKAFGLGAISVGAPYFNSTFNPLAGVLLMLCAVGSALAWKQDTFGKHQRIIVLPLLIAVIAVTCLRPASLIAMLCLCGALWLIGSQIMQAYHKRNSMTPSLAAMFTAHFGLGLMVLAMVCNHLGAEQKEVSLGKNKSVEIAGYTLTLKDVRAVAGKNYFARQGQVEVEKNNKVFMLYPETRYYPVESQKTTEAAIRYTLSGDLYAVIGEKDPAHDAFAMRIYWRPGMLFLWLGVVLMAVGGGLGLWSRRKA